MARTGARDALLTAVGLLAGAIAAGGLVGPAISLRAGTELRAGTDLRTGVAARVIGARLVKVDVILRKVGE